MIFAEKNYNIVNAYDNAVRYNDYIVSQIIQIGEENNAIVIYFSDHGDEVYDFRDFYGHSESKVSVYMAEVPFYLYIPANYEDEDFLAKLKQIDHPVSITYINSILQKLLSVHTTKYIPPELVIDKIGDERYEKL